MIRLRRSESLATRLRGCGSCNLFLRWRNQTGCSVLKETDVESYGAKKPDLEISSWWGRALVGRRPKWTLVRVLALVMVIFVSFKFVFIPIRVEGNSMTPTFKNGRINLVNQLAYRWHAPRRGDVVAVREQGTYTVLLKRVVGLPGERIAIRRGVVMVNGKALIESYAHGQDISLWNEIVLGDDEFFVVGDNRDISVFFTVHRHQILGRALL